MILLQYNHRGTDFLIHLQQCTCTMSTLAIIPTSLSRFAWVNIHRRCSLSWVCNALIFLSKSCQVLFSLPPSLVQGSIGHVQDHLRLGTQQLQWQDVFLWFQHRYWAGIVGQRNGICRNINKRIIPVKQPHLWIENLGEWRCYL